MFPLQGIIMEETAQAVSAVADSRNEQLIRIYRFGDIDAGHLYRLCLTNTQD